MVVVVVAVTSSGKGGVAAVPAAVVRRGGFWRVRQLQSRLAELCTDRRRHFHLHMTSAWSRCPEVLLCTAGAHLDLVSVTDERQRSETRM